MLKGLTLGTADLAKTWALLLATGELTELAQSSCTA